MKKKGARLCHRFNLSARGGKRDQRKCIVAFFVAFEKTTAALKKKRRVSKEGASSPRDRNFPPGTRHLWREKHVQLWRLGSQQRHASPSATPGILIRLEKSGLYSCCLRSLRQPLRGIPPREDYDPHHPNLRQRQGETAKVSGGYIGVVHSASPFFRPLLPKKKTDSAGGPVGCLSPTLSHLQEADDAVVVGRHEGSREDPPTSRCLPQGQPSRLALAHVAGDPFPLAWRRAAAEGQASRQAGGQAGRQAEKPR